MQLAIAGKNTEITDSLRKYVEKKIGRLDRYLPNIIDARVELTVETPRAAKDSQIAQVTLRTKHAILRAEEASSDMFTSIDAVFDKMQRQADRYKGKRWSNAAWRAKSRSSRLLKRRAPRPTNSRPASSPRRAFRWRRWMKRKPSTRWNSWGTTSSSSSIWTANQINVVYRRSGGDYGLIQPELA